MLQEHGKLDKEDFAYQLRVWAQVRTAFDLLTTVDRFLSINRPVLSVCTRLTHREAKPDAINLYVRLEDSYFIRHCQCLWSLCP